MFIGAHTVVYSSDPNADRAFFRDVLKLKGVDAGGGFMIFGLPPAEVSLHEAGEHGRHKLHLMCDDVEAFIDEMQKSGIACEAAQDEGWGLLTQITLPSGGKLGVYQPRHARPAAPRARGPTKARTRPTRKPAKKSAAKKKKR